MVETMQNIESLTNGMGWMVVPIIKSSFLFKCHNAKKQSVPGLFHFYIFLFSTGKCRGQKTKRGCVWREGEWVAYCFASFCQVDQSITENDIYQSILNTIMILHSN